MFGDTIMKKFIIVLSLSFILLPFGLGAEDASIPFAIYLVKQNHAEIEKVVLDPEPIISDKDIVIYDWKNHLITLTQTGADKIPKKTGTKFLIVVNGQRCYQGAFWSSLLSASYGHPIIDVMKSNHMIKIERAYPSSKFAIGDDPRSDMKIKQVLKTINKIKITEPKL